MTAPLVTTRDGHVLLIPQDVSLDELAEAVHEWEAARDYRQALWDNRTTTGPDYTQAERIEQDRFYEVRDLLTVAMSPAEARVHYDRVRTAAIGIERLRDAS